jgi:hypothetical protein
MTLSMAMLAFFSAGAIVLPLKRVASMMTSWERDRAIDRVVELVETVEREPMPVPVREIWVFGDVALGLDPVDRIDVYLAKDILLETDEEPVSETEAFDGIDGVGKTVRREWAQSYPEYVRANAGGYAAPEQCLAAHLLEDDEPIHLEVCNVGFEDNVTQRLEGAMARETYEEILDPRGVCLWIDGEWSESAIEQLRAGEFAFPTLPDALTMLGLDEEAARDAASAVEGYRETLDGPSVRGDVV